jgi:hypothetical protein
VNRIEIIAPFQGGKNFNTRHEKQNLYGDRAPLGKIDSKDFILSGALLTLYLKVFITN